MFSTTTALAPKERLEELFDELAELTGNRNAIDSRIVEIAAEIDRDQLVGLTGARSVAALVAWKTGVTARNAEAVVAIARRIDEFPRCFAGMREGRLSLDQVGIIAERAGHGADSHYAELAAVATVAQLRTAVKLEPQPEPTPKPEPRREFSRTDDGDYATYRLRLPRVEAAKFDAAVQSHHDRVIAEWRRDHGEAAGDQTPPFPNRVDAVMSLVEAGWDSDVARRPHGAHTTVIVHLDAEKRSAALHLGPVLSDADRQLLLCDATCEVWLKRHGQVIGAGRTTRTVSRRLRRALEHRGRCCVVPGCGATRGLHAHHIRHWEDGGPTELWNLVLVCPHHHREHHRGAIVISGTAENLVITDSDGDVLTHGPLARPPTTPAPSAKPYRGPLGERAQWKWYTPFQAPPPTNNQRRHHPTLPSG